MRDDQDEVIDRIVDELKALPAVPADATARVLARVGAARRGESAGTRADEADDDVIFFPAMTDEMPAVPPALSPAAGRPLPAAGVRRRFFVSLPAAIGYALAATLAGFLIRGALPRAAGSPSSVSQTARIDDSALSTTGPSLIPVTSETSRLAQEQPVPVQFVLDARRATRVSVVGDFNGWDSSSTPLTRDSASGAWTALVRVTPGRHVYAFLVDDGVWTLDPRAPRAKDPDYGAEQSVMIVGAQ